MKNEKKQNKNKEMNKNRKKREKRGEEMRTKKNSARNLKSITINIFFKYQHNFMTKKKK